MSACSRTYPAIDVGDEYKGIKGNLAEAKSMAEHTILRIRTYNIENRNIQCCNTCVKLRDEALVELALTIKL